ncbi:MAG TPA: Gfo/Idh/MocA family oxidoreductase [Bacteroidales bacterium]|nr:Gfo/Idh/MocA family oxidoreductase [Bacteroidales bacterium]
MEKEKKEDIQSLTRRKFIADGALIASVFTIIPRYVMGGPGYVPPSDKLNIACVGVGGKGRVDLDGVSTENIIALCDVDEVQATKKLKQFDENAYEANPKARKYKDFRVMLEKEKDIDAITVSTPDHMHAIITMTAMKMGKNVYTQKPLTRIISESRIITNFAKKAGIVTQMGNQGHANEGPRILNELIWQGAIGKVHEVHCWTDRPIWPQGIPNRPKDEPQVPSTLDWDLWLGITNYRPYNPAYVPFAWRAWWDFGCGALGDMGCHVMDYPFWTLKLKSPLSIEAYSTKVFEETAPLGSVIHYDFISGLDSTPVKLIWYDGGLKPPVPEGLKSDVNLLKPILPWSGVLFKGELGEIVYGHHSPKPILLINGKEYDYEMPKEMIPRSIGHYKEWIAECKGGKQKAMSNFDYAGPLTEVVLLGNVALRAGQKLYWDAAKMEFPNAPKANKFLHYEYRDGWNL